MREVAVVTTGFFDGVHLGHRHVLETLVSAARERGEEAIVVTFWPHPRTVLQQDAREFRLLSSLDEKKELLLAAGAHRVEVLPFTRSFAALTALEYLQLLQERFGASLVVMGYDNRIGSDRLTATQLMQSASEGIGPQTVGFADPSQSPSCRCSSKLAHQQAGLWAPPSYVAEGGHRFGDQHPLLPCIAVVAEYACHSELSSCHSERSEESFSSCHTEHSSCHTERSECISSTQIRKALEGGDIGRANAMLGYPYQLYGVVVAGNRLGRTIGFPTANMQLYEPLKLVPGNGVYAVEVEVLGGSWRGMCNIGTRPTVGGTVRTIETHILEFDEDIYGLPMRLRFLRRIRDERKFPSLEALRAQLQEDSTQLRRMEVTD